MSGTKKSTSKKSAAKKSAKKTAAKKSIRKKPAAKKTTPKKRVTKKSAAKTPAKAAAKKPAAKKAASKKSAVKKSPAAKKTASKAAAATPKQSVPTPKKPTAKKKLVKTRAQSAFVPKSKLLKPQRKATLSNTFKKGESADFAQPTSVALAVVPFSSVSWSATPEHALLAITHYSGLVFTVVGVFFMAFYMQALTKAAMTIESGANVPLGASLIDSTTANTTASSAADVQAFGSLWVMVLLAFLVTAAGWLITRVGEQYFAEKQATKSLTIYKSKSLMVVGPTSRV